MNKKFKGQGALEYLLLIGGAVLIAVIVIALLVGMGGQSRDTAQEQADRAQQAADVPQPAQIVAVESSFTDCNAATGYAQIKVNWRPLGEGGIQRLYIADSNNRDLNYYFKPAAPAGAPQVYYQSDTNALLMTANQLAVDLNVIITPSRACGDSYYAYITTTKNNQTVTSSKFRFGWWN